MILRFRVCCVFGCALAPVNQSPKRVPRSQRRSKIAIVQGCYTMENVPNAKNGEKMGRTGKIRQKTKRGKKWPENPKKWKIGAPEAAASQTRRRAPPVLLEGVLTRYPEIGDRPQKKKLRGIHPINKSREKKVARASQPRGQKRLKDVWQKVEKLENWLSLALYRHFSSFFDPGTERPWEPFGFSGVSGPNGPNDSCKGSGGLQPHSQLLT